MLFDILLLKVRISTTPSFSKFAVFSGVINMVLLLFVLRLVLCCIKHANHLIFDF